MSASATDLEKERRQYNKKLRSVPVLAWKCTKVLLRAQWQGGYDAEETLNVPADSVGRAAAINGYVDEIARRLRADSADRTTLHLRDHLAIAKDIWGMRREIIASDEDAYPLFLEKMTTPAQFDSLMAFFRQNNIAYDSNTEHIYFAILAATAWKLSDDIVLYELSEVDFSGMMNTDLRVIGLLMKSYYFSRNKWFYLADESMTSLIGDLESRDTEIRSGLELPGSGKTDPVAIRHYYLSSLYYSRAMIRHLCQDEDMRKAARKDIGEAGGHALKAGYSGPSVLIISAAVALENGEKKNAVKFLKQVEAHPRSSYEEVKLAGICAGKIQRGEKQEALADLNAHMSDHYSGGHMVLELVSFSIDKKGYIKQVCRERSDHPMVRLIRSHQQLEEGVSAKQVSHGVRRKVSDFWEKDVD